MATSVKDAHEHDDNDKKAPNKKGVTIKPIHEKELKKVVSDNKEHMQENADLLAELAKKTAELAEQVKGTEVQETRILELESSEQVPKDIFASLEDDPVEEVLTENQSESSTSNTISEPANPAAELIRAKLNKLYSAEPSAVEEAAEAIELKNKRSKHQEFMYGLTTSGKSLADIQTDWHNYYVGLSDNEKHEVWQEFYQNQSAISAYARESSTGKNTAGKNTKETESKTVKEIKSQIIKKVNADGKLKPIHHAKSALFGIGLASIVALIIAFVFFNQVFVAPFISPSKTVSATPIIGNNTTDIGPDPKLIIPKINLEVPVVYDLDTIEEDAIQKGLEDGVVHYASTPNPGQNGNVVIVGHSSNNILNSGKYKFAFVLLKRLEVEDTFFVHKDGVRYTYKVYEKKVVPPTDVSVLGPASRDNSITLITCDPPGTSVNRLIITAEQISPDPSNNTQADIKLNEESQTLPSNAESLWSRLTGWL
jgi:sortase A